MATQITRPTGGGGGGWTPSSGSDDWLMVDEVIADEDSTYIESDGGNNCYFTYPAFSITSSTITGLQTHLRSRLTSGAGNVVHKLQVNSSFYTGNTESQTTSYADYSHTYATNPDTGVAWLEADIEGTGSNPLEAAGFKDSGVFSPETLRVTQAWLVADYTVTGGTDVTATTDALVLTEYNTEVNAEASVHAGLDVLTITTYPTSVTVTTDVDVSATTANLTIVEYTASVALNKSVQATTDVLVITPHSSTVSLVTGTNVLATTASLSITGYVATVNAANNIQASYDSLILSSHTCTITTTTLGDRIAIIEDYLSAGPITDSANYVLQIDDGSLTMYYKEGKYHVI